MAKNNPTTNYQLLSTTPAPLLVIVGETASGKSGLALELAKRFGCELVNADSWTVYRDFDIGTAKPTKAERAVVPHHLLDIADPAEGFNAALYKRLAQAVIADVHARGNVPIMVGGTGLYIDSVLYDYSFLPTANPVERSERNQRELTELLDEALRLGIDMNGIDTQNKRRVIRALETNGQRPTSSTLRPNTLIIGLQTSREELRQRITSRVDGMLVAGLELEVQSLYLKYGWGVEPMKGIGYREWRDYFDSRAFVEQRILPENLLSGVHVPTSTLHSGAQFSNKLHNSTKAHENPIAVEEVREKIISASMNLAKRQRTWLKRNKSIHWVKGPSEPISLVTKWLQTGSSE